MEIKNRYHDKSSIENQEDSSKSDQQQALPTFQTTHMQIKNKKMNISRTILIFVLILFCALLGYEIQDTSMKQGKQSRPNVPQEWNIKTEQQQIQENEGKNKTQIVNPTLKFGNETKNQNNSIREIESNLTNSKIDSQSAHIPSRQQQLRKHYSPGLKNYYESIEQNITIVLHKIFSPNFNSKAQIKRISYIVDGLGNCTPDNYIQSIQSLLENVEDVNEIVWLVDGDNGGFYAKLIGYLKDKGLKYEQLRHRVDITYGFLREYISKDTQWLIFLTNSIKIATTSYQLLLSAQPSKLAFIDSSSSTLLQLQSDADLSGLDSNAFAQYVISFRVKLLQVITPVNFAYQNVYTLAELVVCPVLVFAQLSAGLWLDQRLIEFQVNHQSIGQDGSKVQFVLARLLDVGDKSNICFLGYPTVPEINMVTETVQYLEQFVNFSTLQHDKNSSFEITIIVAIVYSPLQSLHEVTQKILHLSSTNANLSIRLKVRQNKVLSSLQVYELSYGYCSLKSVVFTSRFNAVPNLKQLLSSVSRTKLCHRDKYFMLTGYHNSDGDDVKIEGLASNKRRSDLIKYYRNQLLNAQIFCMQLAAELRLQIFKWQELEFYETEASFIVPMLERTAYNFTLQQNPIYRVMRDRKISDKEQKQTNGLLYRDSKKSIKQKPITAVKYYELNNHAYKKNPKDLIPPIIHQIWLSNSKEMSPLRIALAETLKKTNPQFEYRLWTLQNMTKDNFPITFPSILKFQAIEQQYGKNYRALIADLMRIQILYKFGGVYMDLKTEGIHPLKPFLKYQQFYFVANDENVVNGLIGSVAGDRHFRTMLQEFFRPELLRVPKNHIFQLTGGTKMVEAYTLKQVYTQVLNFQQFILEGPRPCVHGSGDKIKQPGQKQFTGITAFVKKSKYRVLIPCKDDQEKYLQLYDIIGRTYLPGADPFS